MLVQIVDENRDCDDPHGVFERNVSIQDIEAHGNLLGESAGLDDTLTPAILALFGIDRVQTSDHHGLRRNSRVRFYNWPFAKKLTEFEEPTKNLKTLYYCAQRNLAGVMPFLSLRLSGCHGGHATMQRIKSLIVCVLVVSGFCSDSHAQKPRSGVSSGLELGETVEPWRPIHVAGPDRGTTACPVCTYLDKPAVVVFTKDGENAVELARRVEALVTAHRDKGLKGFVVVLDSTPARLAGTARRAGVSRSALCYPDPATKAEDLKAYKINPAATSTILVYKDYTVAARFVDLSAPDFARVEAATAKLVR